MRQGSSYGLVEGSYGACWLASPSPTTMQPERPIHVCMCPGPRLSTLRILDHSRLEHEVLEEVERQEERRDKHKSYQRGAHPGQISDLNDPGPKASDLIQTPSWADSAEAVVGDIFGEVSAAEIPDLGIPHSVRRSGIDLPLEHHLVSGSNGDGLFVILLHNLAA